MKLHSYSSNCHIRQTGTNDRRGRKAKAEGSARRRPRGNRSATIWSVVAEATTRKDWAEAARQAGGRQGVAGVNPAATKSKAKGGADVGVYGTKGCDWRCEWIRLRRRAATAKARPEGGRKEGGSPWGWMSWLKPRPAKIGRRREAKKRQGLAGVKPAATKSKAKGDADVGVYATKGCV